MRSGFCGCSWIFSGLTSHIAAPALPSHSIPWDAVRSSHRVVGRDCSSHMFCLYPSLWHLHVLTSLSLSIGFLGNENPSAFLLLFTPFFFFKAHTVYPSSKKGWGGLVMDRGVDGSVPSFPQDYWDMERIVLPGLVSVGPDVLPYLYLSSHLGFEQKHSQVSGILAHVEWRMSSLEFISVDRSTFSKTPEIPSYLLFIHHCFWYGFSGSHSGVGGNMCKFGRAYRTCSAVSWMWKYSKARYLFLERVLKYS